MSVKTRYGRDLPGILVLSGIPRVTIRELMLGRGSQSALNFTRRVADKTPHAQIRVAKVSLVGGEDARSAFQVLENFGVIRFGHRARVVTINTLLGMR